MSQFPSPRRGPPTSTGLLLVGVGDAAPGALAPLPAVRSALISWLLLAPQLGLTSDSLCIACDPPLGLADLVEALVGEALSPAEGRAAWTLFVRHALHGGPAGEALERARAADWAAPDQLAPPLRAWRALLSRTTGPEATLQPATRLVLDTYAGAGRPIPRMDALELAAPILFGGSITPALRLARAVADLLDALHERGWEDPGQDPHCARLAQQLVQADHAAAARPANPEASWDRLAEAVLALDPGLRDQAPTRATVLAGLRGLVTRCRGGLVVFCGHEGRADGLPVLACADATPSPGGLAVGARAFDPRGLLTVDDLAAALGDRARAWTLALDTQHEGGFDSPPGDPDDWTWRGLVARVLSASGPAAPPEGPGAFTRALCEVLRGCPMVPDGSGRALGLTNGELTTRANQRLGAAGVRVTIASPEPVDELPFLGADPEAQESDPGDPFELWPGSDEIIGLEVLNAFDVRKLVLFATREKASFGWASDLNAVTSQPGWKLRVTLSTDIDGMANPWVAWAQQSASGLRKEVGTAPSGGIFAPNGSTLTPVAKRLDGMGRKISFAVVGDALRIYIDQPPGGNGLLSPGWFGVMGPDQPPRVVVEWAAAGWPCGSFLDLLS